MQTDFCSRVFSNRKHVFEMIIVYDNVQFDMFLSLGLKECVDTLEAK